MARFPCNWPLSGGNPASTTPAESAHIPAFEGRFFFCGNDGASPEGQYMHYSLLIGALHDLLIPLDLVL